MKYTFQGLSTEEVEKSRSEFGANILPLAQSESFWAKFLGNFKNPIIIILCVALAVILILSFFGLTEWYEALAIAVAVLLAVLVSTYSEFSSESSFQKLQEEASHIKNKVFRNGQITEILVEEIVKGDYILLQSGNQVPADGEVKQGELKVNQASLTGEFENVNKVPTTQDTSIDANNFSDPHYVFKGSVISEGEAVILIEQVGESTHYGQLSRELSLSDERLSPLQLKLEKLAHLISKFGYWGAGLITLAYLFNKIIVQNNFDVTLISSYFIEGSHILPDVLNALVLGIIIIVAAVPEGLPMMIAIVLSLNMRKMLQEKVLVRKLLGIETAGSLNLLFTDKTGTLTKGQLEPSFILTGNQERYDDYVQIPETLRHILQVAVMENSFSVISPEGKPIGGNASERAIIQFIDTKDRLSQSYPVETLNITPFDSAKKFSATEIQGEKAVENLFHHSHLTLVKGATEIILQNCDAYYDSEGNEKTFDRKQNLLKQADELAEKGIRLIGIAASTKKITKDGHLPQNLTLIAVLGIRDEIREETPSAIQEVQEAGIQVVMITGDRQGTAESISREIGLMQSEEDLVLTSTDLQNYSDEELQELLPHLRVVARALPSDKSRLVRIAKSVGKVVGMTGDGVNDSAALKQADVGFAMGSGSEVAKEASDIVILDDNFSSICNAIRYGRTIFKSIRKFIAFQLTVNLAAVLTAFLGTLLGIDFPLTIIQLLWINIIMDSLAAIAFGGEAALRRFMKEKPIAREANILSKNMIAAILSSSLYITIFSLFFLTVPSFSSLFFRSEPKVLLTVFFNLFIFLIVLNAFNVRTEKRNLLDSITLNPIFLQIILLIFVLQIFFTYIGGEVLRTVPLTFIEWFWILALSSLILVVDMFRKTFYSKS